MNITFDDENGKDISIGITDDNKLSFCISNFENWQNGQYIEVDLDDFKKSFDLYYEYIKTGENNAKTN